MSRTPRRPRRLGRHGPPSAPAPRPAAGIDPAGALRALVQEGIVVAASLNARDDLELAAASTQRLGALTSGMWRALSGELATAAQRLDRSTLERMDEVERRARALQVDAHEVAAAGVAAMHLAEHRETIATLVQPDEDRHRLLASDMLLGFDFDIGDDDSDEDNADDDDNELLSVRVSLLLWPAPLTPAKVTIIPSLLADDAEEVPAGSLHLDVAAPEPLLQALSQASGFSSDRVTQALGSLAVACWTAHHLDELPPDEQDEEGIDDDDVEADGADGV